MTVEWAEDRAVPAEDGRSPIAFVVHGDADDSLLPPAPAGWTDPLTSTDGPRFWDRVISTEEARVRRYRRAATIALVEFDGFSELAQRWGREIAEQTFRKVAATLAHEIRSSDYMARVERTRFAILLTESDEISAINFVDRARSACEAQLGLAADVVRVGFGWAGSSAARQDPASIDFKATLDVAARRLAADLARPATED
jgi:diguanylate cyclase (GGDEF)-like protein